MFNTPLGAMIFVNSVTRSVAFYKDQLGFNFTGYMGAEGPTQTWDSTDEPPYAGFDIGGGHLGLHPNDGTHKAGNGCEFHVIVPNADEYHALLTSRGIKTAAPVDTDWGGRTFLVTDPDGHVWDFYHMR